MGTQLANRKIAIAVVTVTSLVFAACGDDGDSSDATTTTGAPTTAAPSGGTGTGGPSMVPTVEGCENGYTDPSDLSVGREVARCTPGNPAPVPLPEMTKITLATSFKLEFNSPVAVAGFLGEYEKENLEVDIVTLSFADAIPQLAGGQVDVAVGDFGSALFNAGHEDLGVKVIAGNYYPPEAGNYDVAQTGLWCRRDTFSTPDDPDFKELEDSTWGTSVGRGSVAVYYSAAEIEKRVPDFDVSKVDAQRIPSTDMLTALNNGALDCGIMLDPLWTEVSDDPDNVQAATQTPGEPLGHMAFGKNLLVDRPEVGQAFLRAYMRTINTYFADDYHQDDAIMAEIQKWTGATDEAQTRLKDFDSLTFDWEIRQDTTTRIQDLFIRLGVIENLDAAVPEDKLVDRSVAMAVLGMN